MTKILWVDDEIELLKPHVMFLAAKGYEVDTCNNGYDAVDMATATAYDLIILDEMMPGMTGLETLPLIKNVRPATPVIMVTKSEEENIMDKAIGSKIADYIIKPVNPNQVLLSIKKNLHSQQLVTEQTTADYRAEFGRIAAQQQMAQTFQDWCGLYRRLTGWEIELADSTDQSIKEVLAYQKNEANQEFCKFVRRNYYDWINNRSDDTPVMSHTLMRTKVFPVVEAHPKTTLLLIDNFRYDQWRALSSLLRGYYDVALDDFYCAILPTATQYARNAVFAGLMPLAIDRLMPDKWLNANEEGGQNRYEEAENGIKESVRLSRAMLNGFPAVNHGVSGCRQVIESVHTPLQVRHGTPDARLLTEITYAGGFTSYEGGGISYNLPYCKNIPMERTIRDWQYVDHLTGLYEEMGVSINREPYGPLTGTLVPPCISHAAAIIEALLAAEKGVKNITVGYGQCGNLVQDVAAIRTLQALTDEYLAKYGYTDVEVTTVLHQWMGGFPADEAKAFGVISTGSLIAAFAKATKVIVKSPHEAVGIPTMEANAQGLRCTKQLTNMLVDQVTVGSRLEHEKEVIKAETRCIMDKCIALGHGDIILGAIAGINAGVIDIPFGPAKCNAGIMLPARDNTGAVRILEPGNLPFTDDLKKFHKEKLEERARVENREVSFQMVIDDVYAISKGRLVGRPR